MEDLTSISKAELLFKNISDKESKIKAFSFAKENCQDVLDFASNEISILSKVSFWTLSLFLTFLPFTLILSSELFSKDIRVFFGIFYVIISSFIIFKLSSYFSELFISKRISWFKKFKELEKEFI